MAIITTFPGKYVWVIGAVLFNLSKLPFLPFYYMPRSNRPEPKWTIRQSIMNHLMSAFLYHTTAVKAVTPLNLEPGSYGNRFVEIPKGPKSLYVDFLLSDPTVVPSSTGALWFPKVPESMPLKTNNPVVLQFHPGGYVMGDVRSDGHFAAKLLTERLNCHSLWSLYRLASNPGGRFPAALQDALTAYHYLLHDLSIPASQIILSGDSAGGHVLICLLRYIADHGLVAGLPAPKAALLWSPAINMSAATESKSITENRNFAKDYLDADFIQWGATQFMSSKTEAAPYMNPLDKPFKSPCPMWIFCGGNEIFCDDITNFVNRMKEVPGNNVSLRVEALANHDIFFAGNITGWKSQAEDAAINAGNWISEINV